MLLRGREKHLYRFPFCSDKLVCMGPSTFSPRLKLNRPTPTGARIARKHRRDTAAHVEHPMQLVFRFHSRWRITKLSRVASGLRLVME